MTMKPNIFLITVDALRADYTYSKNSNIHPFMSSLLDKSLVFENAFSPSYATRLSFKGMFTDFSPLQRCPDLEDFEKYKIPEEASFVAEEFKKRGYTTAGFTSNSFLTRIQNYNRGFDHFYDGLDNIGQDTKKSENDLVSTLDNIAPFDLSHENKFYRRVKAVFNDDVGYSTGLLGRAMKWLENEDGGGPYFVWVHLMEVHSPYRIEPKWFKKIDEKYIPRWDMEKLRQKRQENEKVSDGLTKKDMKRIRRLYRVAIRLVDTNIKRYFGFLKNHDYLDDGSFVLTSDHGEYLGDHGLLTHPSFFYNEGLHIPLIIYDGERQRRINKVYSNLNLLDLLLNISSENIGGYIERLTGLAISEGEKEGNQVFCIQDSDSKLIWNISKGEKTLHKIEKDIKTDQTQIKEEVIDNLQNRLKKHIDNIKTEEENKIKKVLKKLNF